jgi:uncharacterized membrane protein YcgQ (UPF0703/DUF1980 family)
MKKRTSLLFILVIILIIGIISIYNYISFKNTIFITTDNYLEILNDTHEFIDNYIGKKIIVSGYVYILPEFSDDRFVIAQNVALDPSSPSTASIVGFLCQNGTNYQFSSNETIKIKGTFIKGTFNDMDYPVIYFEELLFIIIKHLLNFFICQ